MLVVADLVLEFPESVAPGTDTEFPFTEIDEDVEDEVPVWPEEAAVLRFCDPAFRDVPVEPVVVDVVLVVV